MKSASLAELTKKTNEMLRDSLSKIGVQRDMVEVFVDYDEAESSISFNSYIYFYRDDRKDKIRMGHPVTLGGKITETRTPEHYASTSLVHFNRYWTWLLSLTPDQYETEFGTQCSFSRNALGSTAILPDAPLFDAV